MSIQSQQLQSLLEKIQMLPPERVREVEDFVDFLRQRTQAHSPAPRKSLDFPVISVGQWPPELSLRRADMYGDDGR